MKILCYGDSNTWGYVPNINGYSKNAVMKQYAEQNCWWYALKLKHSVVVDGLCGRAIAHENPWLKGRNALSTIQNDMSRFGKLDLIILQLGTNDCKSQYAETSASILKNYSQLLEKVREVSNAQIVLISPAQIREDNAITKKYYVGACELTKKLDSDLKQFAKQNQCYFVSGFGLETGEDGEHLTLAGHAELGCEIVNLVNVLQSKIKEEYYDLHQR